MAWIESNTDLETHPKTKKLQLKMKWDLDTTIGKLHRFWWWCIKYAEDGDLTHFSYEQLGDAVGLSGDASREFILALIDAQFIDAEPFIRVHDWFERVEKYLTRKYHTSNPAKLKSIAKKYHVYRLRNEGTPKGIPKGDRRGGIKEHHLSFPFPSFPNLSSPILLAEKLKRLILANNPGAKTPADLTKWAEEVYRMVELDKRQMPKVEAVLVWCQADSFWKANILSMQKFREKFDQLKMKMEAQKNGTNTDNRISGEAGYKPGKYTK